MVQNGPNWSKMFQNGLKLVRNGSKCPKWSKMIQHCQIGLTWSNIVQKGSKWSKKCKMVQQISKMVQYGPNSPKLFSQNDRSWCDSSWGNSSEKQP